MIRIINRINPIRSPPRTSAGSVRASAVAWLVLVIEMSGQGLCRDCAALRLGVGSHAKTKTQKVLEQRREKDQCGLEPMTASASARIFSTRPGLRASMFKRSRGSVFEGRMLNRQSLVSSE